MWLIVGLVAGWLAGQFVKGGGFGIVGDIVVGILPNAQYRNQSLTLAADPYLRAEGDWGLELYQDANNEFRAAVSQSPMIV